MNIPGQFVFARFPLAVGSAVLLAAFLASGTVRADDPITGFMKALGMGDDQQLDYPERPPLVVPPKMVLPKPKAKSTFVDPAWPKDPEITQKEAAIAEQITGKTDPGRPLTIDQIRNGRRVGAGLASADAPKAEGKDPRHKLSLEEMATINDIGKRMSAPPPDEQPHYLTDPPAPIRKKAVITPEMQAKAIEATGSNGKPWYQFW